MPRKRVYSSSDSEESEDLREMVKSLSKKIDKLKKRTKRRRRRSPSSSDSFSESSDRSRSNYYYFVLLCFSMLESGGMFHQFYVVCRSAIVNIPLNCIIEKEASSIRSNISTQKCFRMMHILLILFRMHILKSSNI